MPEFDVAATPERTTDRIMKSAVTPRPIAWVSSTSEAGVDNLAPFSAFTFAGSNPPVLLFNTSRKDGDRLKDTARNAIDTGEFAVNVVTEEHLERMDHTSKSLPHDESEFDLAQVERAPCHTISPPRVADAVVTMECTLYDTQEIYDRLMVMGEVEYVHVADDVLTDGRIDSRKLDTVGRLGGPYYTISDPVDFERQF